MKIQLCLWGLVKAIIFSEIYSIKCIRKKYLKSVTQAFVLRNQVKKQIKHKARRIKFEQK